MTASILTKKTRTEEDFLNANPDPLPHSQRPALPGATQAQLFSLGMRVRKSIADGYKLQKPTPPPTTQPTQTHTPPSHQPQPQPQQNPLKRRIDDYFPKRSDQIEVVDH
ncbi:hypothetical protein HDV00_011550 [Rhizophlyctis rosea]|nr:hypothetical protein HDV00_011550 [Rhizophlyctis rosea]